MLPKNDHYNNNSSQYGPPPASAYSASVYSRAPAYDNHAATGDLGMMNAAANPYNDNNNNNNSSYSPYGYGQQTAYAPQTHQSQARYDTASPPSMYVPSVAAPSYHTHAPSVNQGQQMYAPVGRKPVSGTWRDL